MEGALREHERLKVAEKKTPCVRNVHRATYTYWSRYHLHFSLILFLTGTTRVGLYNGTTHCHRKSSMAVLPFALFTTCSGATFRNSILGHLSAGERPSLQDEVCVLLSFNAFKNLTYDISIFSYCQAYPSVIQPASCVANNNSYGVLQVISL